MYARLIKFTMGPGTRETADGMIGRFSDALAAFPGLVKVYFMADYETGTYATLAIWETKAHGEAAFQTIHPKLREALQGLVEEVPYQQLFEVVEVAVPKAQAA
jgi:hypothetical protein